ncbi:hypothetical protein Stube_01270 [Streptomyces tubercidicus]|uniref:Uncharacterized protein n=1 Tax=Streptomyces tubercidicus TaxID=47759 RepID=A0A640UJF9_9ACTN|nr:hypothetical protein Stube_01270 [Streptomyces tubercidicus]
MAVGFRGGASGRFTGRAGRFARPSPLCCCAGHMGVNDMRGAPWGGTGPSADVRRRAGPGGAAARDAGGSSHLSYR